MSGFLFPLICMRVSCSRISTRIPCIRLIPIAFALYEDAKRDIRDLGYGAYAENNCYNLGKLSYGSLVSNSNNSKSKKKKGKKNKTKGSSGGQYDEGVMFATYSTLIGKSKDGTRLDQLIECE